MIEIGSLQNKLNNVAIYCRLSKDDGTSNDSISIQNQKDVLTEYAIDNGWHIYDYYIDDGFSGTNFDRPSFQRLLRDIENGYIQIVITKDLSRLGRNYLQTGYYTEEYFPLKKIRYIALNDNFDTVNEDGNEIIPFKNLINEWYAKDISKKIRFTVSNKMKNGEYVRSVVPLYGYEEGVNGRIINPETAPIVKYIFDEYSKGIPTKQICQSLTEKKIYTPNYYNHQKYGYNVLFEAKAEEDKYTWKPIMVTKILEKIEYQGFLVRGKRETKFKRKGAKFKNQEDWYIFEDRFEPIVSKEQFELVKRLRKSNQRTSTLTFEFAYKGLLYCGYCGKKLRFNKRSELLNQDSGSYRFSCRFKHEEGVATINNLELEFILVSEIKALRDLLLSKKDRFIEFAEIYTKNNKRKKKVNIDTVNLEKLKKRELELDNYIRLAFESYAKGELPKKIYEGMIKNYKDELELVISQLNKYLEADKKNNAIKDYTPSAKILIEYLEGLSEDDILTPETLNFLISKIYIKAYGKRVNNRYTTKEIIIEYNNVDELIKEFVAYEDEQPSGNIC
ncbi:MAG: recombinase family protein [Acholeplasmatales bacterium]|nr:recombinase family protein [Acholeplasmatales bacterium]